MLEWTVSFVGVNHMVGGLPIALARLYYLLQESKFASYIKVRDVYKIRSMTDKIPRYQLDLYQSLCRSFLF